MHKCIDCGKLVKNGFQRCYVCHITHVEHENRRIQAIVNSAIDDGDHLGICSICQDRYTTGDICESCSRQKWIDLHG